MELKLSKKKTPKAKNKSMNKFSVLGFGHLVDWVAILIFSIVLLAILFFLSFSQYGEIVDDINSQEVQNTGKVKVNEDKLEEIIEEIDSKTQPFTEVSDDTSEDEEEISEEEIDETQ